MNDLIEELRIKSIQNYGLAEVESTKNSRYAEWLYGYSAALDYCVEKLKETKEIIK